MVVAAVAAGAIVGWLDLSATEVQGSLLLVMLASFALGMSGLIAPWLAGLSVGVAMAGVHAVAWAIGTAPASGIGSIMAVIPAIAAAYGGRLMGILVERAADSLPYGRLTPERLASEQDLPWYAERSASRTLLATILCGSALIGVPLVHDALVVSGQPIASFVAVIWQVLTLIGWIVLTPVVVAHREGKAEALSADSVATTAAQVIGLAMIHSIALVVLTRVLLIPPGDQEAVSRITHVFGAYVPLDMLTFVLLWTLAYVSNADRHLQEAARESTAKAASLSAELNAGKLSALRAQLRPHFLFNAINTAVVLSSKGDSTAASSVLRSLADLLRYVLDDAAETVKVDDELRFIQEYLNVERARFPDRLSFSIGADAAARNARIPHLLLQPLVENAVRHGIAGKITPGKVQISARIDGDTLRMIVEDDGVGIAAKTDTDSGVGIANTRSRLALIYGKNGKLEIVERPGGGTICRLVVPYGT
jgi:two-component system, LytTR family, sensor kinase